MCRICLTGIYPSFDEHTPNYFRGPAVTSVTEDIFYIICIETTKSQNIIKPTDLKPQP